jgi:hypothetical protein
MTSPHPVSWQNPRILLTLFIVFVCGASAGMLAMALGAHRLMHSSVSPTFTDLKTESVRRLQAQLDLTPQQTEQLETILDDFFTYYHTLQAQLDDVKASGKQRILRILNDDQKKKFEKIVSDLKEKQLR